jgi:hypothetical protein
MRGLVGSYTDFLFVGVCIIVGNGWMGITDVATFLVLDNGPRIISIGLYRRRLTVSSIRELWDQCS